MLTELRYKLPNLIFIGMKMQRSVGGEGFFHKPYNVRTIIQKT